MARIVFPQLTSDVPIGVRRAFEALIEAIEKALPAATAPSGSTLTLKGAVTGSGTVSILVSITDGAVTLSKIAKIESGMVLGRRAAGLGHVELIPMSTFAADIGFGEVDNTSDADKPVSTAQQAALDEKAPLDSPAFTGTVTGISKAMVGLNAVTDDAQVKASQLGAFTAGAVAATGYITLQIGGTTYKLLATT